MSAPNHASRRVVVKAARTRSKAAGLSQHLLPAVCRLGRVIIVVVELRELAGKGVHADAAAALVRVEGPELRRGFGCRTTAAARLLADVRALTLPIWETTLLATRHGSRWRGAQRRPSRRNTKHHDAMPLTLLGTACCAAGAPLPT
jgi:hypothetical protein